MRFCKRDRMVMARTWFFLCFFECFCYLGRMLEVSLYSVLINMAMLAGFLW